MKKVISHVVCLALLCEILLMIATLSVSFLDHRLGFSPTFCTFLLGLVSLLILFVINNQRMSFVPALSPTEYMIGVITGLSLGAACFAWLLSSTYATGVVCSDATTTSVLPIPMIPQHNPSAAGNHTNNGTNALLLTLVPTSAPPRSVDPVMAAACENHQTTTYAIWFWAGLAAWLHAIVAIMMFVGRVELATNSPVYESVLQQQQTPVDFEEAFRRQQQEILGVHQATAIQNRAASMFVGDYSTIPEVTQGHSGSLHGV